MSEWIFVYVSVWLFAILFCVIYSEIRRRRFEPKETDDRVFRCSDCDFVYTDDPTVERARCPHCGCMNDTFTF
ncbi:MAG: hypothetical protein P8L18_05850 [Verrucomicrobiota bacterium]|nr:hypothetical protein [Verrucomicrobiota bacterium]